MKCTIPEISWHNREPVLSVDIYPENGEYYRLASGGGDCHVLIWQMRIAANGAVNQEVVSDLTRHQRAVNCVRWSSSGKYLASGDDDANIIVWQLKTDNIPLLEGESGDKEIWMVYKVMRGHKEDVYDICWSIDSSKILSGSVDNTSILWDVSKGKMDHIMTDHKGFVQGVAWDPKNQIIATISTDRTCRVFDSLGKQVKARIQKGKLILVPENHFLKDKDVKYFHDDTFKSFFRRLQFTPDGSLLIVPSGHIEAENCKTIVNATLIFTLDNFSSPAVILPIPKQSSTVVRCCPILYELREDGPEPIIKLPYRMIFAVGTDRDIILYDTQQQLPFSRFQDIHYTRLTDLTWSQDGLLLVASSTDGFCSLITFEMDELGIPWEKIESEPEENPLEISGCEELIDKDENVDTNNKDVKAEEMVLKQDLKEEIKKRPSFLEQWALKTPKKRKLDDNDKNSDIPVISIPDSPLKNNSNEIEKSQQMDGNRVTEIKQEAQINKLSPKRITPIKVQDNSKNVHSKDNEEASESKEKLVLTPRRIKPILIGSKSSSTSHVQCATSSNGIPARTEDVNILTPKRIKPTPVESQPNKSENNKETTNSVRENINVLIPRRVKPSPVEPQPSTSQTAMDQSNSMEDEVIDIREEESSDSNDDEILTAEEKEDFKEASRSIKAFFSRTPANIATKAKPREEIKTANAKPIEIRRKPRQLKFIKDKVQSNNSLEPTENEGHLSTNKLPGDLDHSNVKPEESGNLKNTLNKAVTSREGESLEGNESTPVVNHVAPEAMSEDTVDTKRLLASEDVEHSEIKPNNIEDISTNMVHKEGTNKNPVTLECDKNILNTKNTREGEVIYLSDSGSGANNTISRTGKSVKASFSKKDQPPPKIKVSSLVKQKTATGIPKRPNKNALLNFLKKSDAKTKKKREEKDSHIEITPEELGARDAWSCDVNKRSKGQELDKEPHKNNVILIDDETEDFCLQLEESQDPCDEKRQECNSSIPSSENSKISDPRKGKSDSEIKNIEDQAQSKSTPKKPRKVPLITLSSPNNKMKKSKI